MAGNDLGEYYTIPVILSFAGIDKQVNTSLGNAFGTAGKKGGADFAKSVAVGIASDKSIEKATETKAKAADKLADAIGKVKVAQLALTQAESKGNIAGRARAVEAVATAERKVAEQTRGQVAATKDLERAIKDADAAKKRLNDSSSSGAGFLSGTGFASKLDGLTSNFSEAGKSSGLAFAAGAGAALLAGGLLAAGTKAAGLVLDGFESVVDSGVAFDKTFNNFQAVTKSSTSQMAAFRQEAIALGGDVNIAGANASDAATAMTELAKAGFTVDQAMAGARGTLQLAAAAQISAAEAATIEGNALNAFGLDATHAGEAADILANVANASSGEMTDFAYGLQAGGTVAHQFGLTIQDTATALGLLANSGIKGSDAGTLLKTSLLALTDQGKPAQGAIEDLGLSVYDANGKFEGMRALFVQLQAASKRMTPEVYQAATSVLFGSDAARLSGIAAEQGADGWDKMATAVEQQGTAAQVAATQNQGLPGVIENIKNAIDTAKLSLYDLISGPLKTIGGAAQQGFSDLAASINTHKPEIIGAFTDISTSIAAGVSGSLRSMGLFTEGLGQMIGGLGNVVGAINQTGEALANLTGDDAKAKTFHDAAQAAYGWGEGLQAAGKALQTAADGVNNIKPGIQAAGDAAEKSARFMRDLSDKVALLPDNKTIVLKDNTDVVGLNLDTTKYKIETLPDGKVSIVALTQDATDEMEAWRKSQEQAPPTPLPVTADTRPAQAVIDSFKAQLAGQPAGVPQLTPSGAPPSTISGLLLPPAPRAVGGIYDVWKSVASFANGKLPNQAMIQAPVGGAGLVQWAEPSTRGEAFIPLGGGDRSKAIWAETGRRLYSYDQGGIRAPDVAAAQALAGTPYSQGSRNDCSGDVARVIARTLGLPETGLMSTKNAAQWLAQAGFQQGLGGPGQISVGWYDHGPNPNDGHMAMTLSDGTNAEAGGKNSVFTLGANAAGANSPQFDQHMFLPTLFGEGKSGSFSGYGGSSSGGGGGGGTAGVGPNGEAGSYSAPDAKSVREANEKVTDADQRVAQAEAKQRELKADAKDSEKLSAQADVDKAKREAADARTDAAETQKGKFTPGGKGGKSASGTSSLKDILGIVGGGLKETFGIGDFLPDLADSPWLKSADAALTAFLPLALGGSGGGPADSGGPQTSSMPFGIPDVAAPPPPGTPASGVGSGALPGPPPQVNIDASTQIAGNVGWSADETEQRRRRNEQRAIPRIPVGV